MARGLSYDLVSLKGYEQLQRRLNAIGVTGDFMHQLGFMAVREAKAIVPRKTSNLEHTIHVASFTPTSVQVVAGGDKKVGYAAYVEYGTGPHDITPNAKKALRWAVSSSKGFRATGSPSSAKGNKIGYAFAKRVHHPGTRAQPYLMPGAKRAVEQTGLQALVDKWNGAA